MLPELTASKRDNHQWLRPGLTVLGALVMMSGAPVQSNAAEWGDGSVIDVEVQTVAAGDVPLPMLSQPKAMHAPRSMGDACEFYCTARKEGLRIMVEAREVLCIGRGTKGYYHPMFRGKVHGYLLGVDGHPGLSGTSHTSHMIGSTRLVHSLMSYGVKRAKLVLTAPIKQTSGEGHL